jgi:hypothetical protein
MRGHLRKRGNAWELRAYAGIDPLTNRQKYVTRTFRGGKREAEEALARSVTEVACGGHTAQDTTVGDLIDDWLAMARRELSPTTARGYDWIVKTYIKPTLGKVPLARLRAAQLDRFYAKLRDEGGQDGKPLSAATVRQVHAILRRALQQGVRWGWITTNPASLASPPRVRSRQLEPPDPDKVVQLIETAEKEADSTGRRNTSITEVCDGSRQKAVTGGAGRCQAAMGSGPGPASTDALSRTTSTITGGAAGLLAADRHGDHDGRSVSRCGRVGPGRDSVVQTRWRDAAAESGRTVGPLPIVRRA